MKTQTEQLHDELRVAAAAERLNCSDWKVRSLIQEGRLEGRKLDPQKKNSPLLISLDSLKKYEQEAYAPFRHGDSLAAQG
ncbi:MAG: hypothetical protein DRP85_09115 [Candidatus Makaraimicrobium thalassicum]|nr:MAG: hypothetical protein DRP85_09115 [Candidatus Omnitrophota bacterium]